MKNLLIVLMSFFASLAGATEMIKIFSPYTSAHPGHAAIYQMIDRINQSQNQFRLVMELKPGAAGILALKQVDAAPNTSVGLIHASFVQNSLDGVINKNEYVPISSLGDACWFVVAKQGDEKQGLSSLTSVKEDLMFGGVGVGSASHLVSIEIAKLLQRSVQFVPFSSTVDAGVLLVGNHGINMALVPMREYQNLAAKNPSLKRLAIHCQRRHPDAPWVSTTREQKLVAPYVLNTFVVHRNMPDDLRRDLARLFDQAITEVGADKILEISSFFPPVFAKQSVADYHNERIDLLTNSLRQHSAEIQRFKKN